MYRIRFEPRQELNTEDNPGATDLVQNRHLTAKLAPKPMGKTLLSCDFTDRSHRHPKLQHKTSLAENTAVIQRGWHGEECACSKTGGCAGENEKLTHLFCRMKQKETKKSCRSSFQDECLELPSVFQIRVRFFFCTPVKTDRKASLIQSRYLENNLYQSREACSISPSL